jgi:hypothetical protein
MMNSFVDALGRRFWRPAIALAAAGLLCGSASAAEKSAADGKVLIELFTSQGCASCPKANAYLGVLRNDPHAIALTYAVGYWDYLGWRDTFAKPEFAERQKKYAAHFKRGIYTPQMVINGEAHTSGLMPAVLRAMLAANPMVGGAQIEGASEAGAAKITVTGAAPDAPAEVWLAQYTPGPVYVDVTNGENAGSHVAHFNVVTKLTDLGRWNGGAQKFAGACAPACAVIVQEADGGRVIAAQGLGAAGS